jgi:hypothetical protein
MGAPKADATPAAAPQATKSVCMCEDNGWNYGNIVSVVMERMN